MEHLEARGNDFDFDLIKVTVLGETSKVRNIPPGIVAEMCGTSITQIENTYCYTTEDKMVSNALAGYYVKDGMLITK